MTKRFRLLAREEAGRVDISVPDVGDIAIAVHFYPPNRKSDRVNFPNRMKPYFDGIADALRVNDCRFLPTYHFHDPVVGGAVIVEVE